MSFSRAPLKRFNEHSGCAPPPGSYEVKSGEPKGAASFQKAERFRAGKTGDAPQMPPPSPSKCVPLSPVRRTMSVDALAGGSSAKKERTGMTMEMKQQKLLEKEIRSLVQQRGEQERRLLSLEDELKKAEAKLLVAIREKTGFSSNATTMERQIAELKKVNEFLKNKVSADTSKKRINSLTMELMDTRNKLDVKNKEFCFLEINTVGQVQELKTDLEAARAAVATLKEGNKDLEELQQDTKMQNGELETEVDKLHAVIRELREEIKVLQDYLDTANDQIQDLRVKLREKTELECTAAHSLQEEKARLEQELLQCRAELLMSEDALRQKEEDSTQYRQELQASQEYLRDVEKGLEPNENKEQLEQEVENCRSTVRQQEAELARLRDVLRRTEQELDERVAHLAERCLFFEEERSKTQEEGMRRVEELKAELTSLKEVKREEKKRQIQLQQEHAALSDELKKEKGLVDSLSVIVEQEREEAEEQLRQLKDEMEEVLGELSAMEEQEIRRREQMEEKQEALQSLQQENGDLATRLSEARALLDSKRSGLAVFEAKHLAAVEKLKEEQRNSLSKLEDLSTELKSTNQALSDAKENVKELEAEVERLSRHLKEEVDRVIQHKEEELEKVRQILKEQREEHLASQQTQEKAREEVVLEMRTCLAEKDERMEAMKASHAALVAQLEEEIRRQKDEALVQRLQGEKLEAQKLLQRVREEGEETLRELQHEREENAKAKAALQGEREAREAEKELSLQRMAETLGLQAQREELDEQSRILRSQLELKENDGLALRSKLTSAEQEAEQLRSHLDNIRQEHSILGTRAERAEEENHALQQEVQGLMQDGLALQGQVEILAQEKVTLQWEVEDQRLQLHRALAEAQEKSSSSETEKWKKLYEELFCKVKPFQEQLNGFAAERAALLNENGENQEKLNRLANAYAHLLGHQNQKQKIKHVVKLKDENVALKQELTKLRAQVSRQKSDLEQVRSLLPGAQRRRFDPSKAFQHDSKENRQPQTLAALREGNHQF